jgi:type I restriction enzyme M protein
MAHGLKQAFSFAKKDAPSDQPQSAVFMAVARNTGLAPNGDAVPGNVLPDILLDYRDFRKGKLLPGQAGTQSESLCVDLVERLDAEFYARKAHARVVDLPALRLDVEAAQVEVVNGYAALAGVSGTFRDLETEPVRLGEVLEQVEVREDSAGASLSAARRALARRGRSSGKKSLVGVSKPPCISGQQGMDHLQPPFRFPRVIRGTQPRSRWLPCLQRIPTFRPKSDVMHGDLLSRYIVHCLNSPQYLAVIDAESTGSTKTSRNRFNEEESWTSLCRYQNYRRFTSCGWLAG